MKRLTAFALALMIVTGCTAEKKSDAPAADQTAATAATETTATTATTATATDSAPQASTSTVDGQPGTWAGQLKVAQPVSVLNYVGAESGDFVPMRFRSDAEAGKKILAACGNDDMCEVTGVVQFLDEAPPENASAVGEIVRVDSVRKLPPATP